MVRWLSMGLVALLLAVGGMALNVQSPVDVDDGNLIVQAPVSDTLTAEAGGGYYYHWHWGSYWCGNYHNGSNTCYWYPRTSCVYQPNNAGTPYIVKNFVVFYWESVTGVRYHLASKYVYYFATSCLATT